jgi:hypothetical protein
VKLKINTKMRENETEDDPLGLKMGINITKTILFLILGLILFFTLYFLFK